MKKEKTLKFICIQSVYKIIKFCLSKNKNENSGKRKEKKTVAMRSRSADKMEKMRKVGRLYLGTKSMYPFGRTI